jgi:phage baseplate assembly protein V
MSGYDPNIRSQLLRAILASVDDSGPQQLLKLTGLAGQTIGEAVRSQHFGLTSVPPVGAEALILALGGGFDRAHALGVEHPAKRPTNTPAGGTVLYDAYGDAISIVQANMRLVHSAKISLVAPEIELIGAVTLGGEAGSGVPAAKQGTVDTGGFADEANLATKVNVN